MCAAVDELARQENVDGESVTLLRTAALFHDSGFINQYSDNEALAVKMAEEVLPALAVSTVVRLMPKILAMLTCIL